MECANLSCPGKRLDREGRRWLSPLQRGWSRVRDATVCICHAKTRDLAQFTILADILIVAAGTPNLILPQMVKTGAVVIDVGINRLPDGRIAGERGLFKGVVRKASYITPVPGGVGPMTVTMLLENTIAAAERAAGYLSRAR